MFNQVARSQSVLELINRLATGESNLLEPCPHQQSTGDVIALNALKATLARLNACGLFDLTMKLLNLPAHGTHLLRVIRRILS